MNYEETINQLKNHIRCTLYKKGFLDKRDDAWCIRYLMDFLFCDRAKAKGIYAEVRNEVMV